MVVDTGSVIVGSVTVVVVSCGSVIVGSVSVLVLLLVVVVVEGRVVEVGGGRLVVVVVVTGRVVEVVGRVVLVVVVGGRVVVVVVVAGCVVPVVEAGRKVASTMNQLVAEPRVRLPSCGPSALERMSSRREEALPFRTSRTYGTLWLLPGSAEAG